MLTPPRLARYHSGVTRSSTSTTKSSLGGELLAVQDSTKIQHLTAEARIARESERALDRASDVLGLAAVASARFGSAGMTLGVVLGVGASASALMASSAGEQAEKLEAQLEAEKSKVSPPSTSGVPNNKTKFAPRQNEEADIRRMGTFGRGDTFGGRASAHDPGRSDAISRTC